MESKNILLSTLPQFKHIVFKFRNDVTRRPTFWSQDPSPLATPFIGAPDLGVFLIGFLSFWLRLSATWIGSRSFSSGTDNRLWGPS